MKEILENHFKRKIEFSNLTITTSICLFLFATGKLISPFAITKNLNYSNSFAQQLLHSLNLIFALLIPIILSFIWRDNWIKKVLNSNHKRQSDFSATLGHTTNKEFFFSIISILLTFYILFILVINSDYLIEGTNQYDFMNFISISFDFLGYNIYFVGFLALSFASLLLRKSILYFITGSILYIHKFYLFILSISDKYNYNLSIYSIINIDSQIILPTLLMLFLTTITILSCFLSYFFNGNGISDFGQIYLTRKELNLSLSVLNVFLGCECYLIGLLS